MFGKSKDGKQTIPHYKKIPYFAGIYMIREMKKDADWVWALKGVTRPAKRKGAYYVRVFDAVQTTQAGVVVKDWESLDEHPELVFFEGICEDYPESGLDKDAARPEKFVKA